MCVLVVERNKTETTFVPHMENERNKINSYIQKRILEEQKNFSKYVCWSWNGNDIDQWTAHIQVQSLELRHNGHKCFSFVMMYQQSLQIV
jgi:hypothetical protein